MNSLLSGAWISASAHEYEQSSSQEEKYVLRVPVQELNQCDYWELFVKSGICLYMNTLLHMHVYDELTS